MTTSDRTWFLGVDDDGRLEVIYDESLFWLDFGFFLAMYNYLYANDIEEAEDPFEGFMPAA